MAGRSGTRETPRKLAPPRGVPGPAVSAPRGRSRRYERPFDRSCLTVRPRPSGKVSFRPVPARGPLPMAPCGADSAPFGGCPVGRSRPPFGLRADPFGPDVPVPVSLPGDTREGRACGGVRPPKTPMRFRERRRRFARRVEIRDTRYETRDTRHQTRGGRHLRGSGSQAAASRPSFARAPSPTPWWRERRSLRVWGAGTREAPREFGLRLTLSGFSIETACTISKYLRLWFDPSSSVSARFLRAPVLPFALRPLPVRAVPEDAA